MQNLSGITFWLSVFSFFVRLTSVDSKECKSMDIRQEPKNLLILTNCTAILGSLSIVLIDDINKMDEINQYSFPKLKEITGYLLLFYVKGLNSTGKLFPNLTVIRGQQLILSYSLMIFEMPQLTEIGLKSLISIQRGYVFIEHCPALCYHDTVDWEAITDEEEKDLGAGKGNIIQKNLHYRCPTREVCRSCPDHFCWSSFDCQTYDSNHFLEEKVEQLCHPFCLGGCVNETEAGCTVCAGFKLDGTCIDECPSHLYKLNETMRCVPAKSCIQANLIPFEGECRQKCPDKYSNQDPETKMIDKTKCFKCEIKCPQNCNGAIVQGAADLEHFRGCNIIYGPLYIKLGLNMTDIKEKLEQTLGNIEEIHGVLKIFRSFSLTSLSFFRNLILINSTDIKLYIDDDPYSIEITENANLQTLFNWKEKLNFQIIGRGMSFHFNSKLCVEEIHNFQRITDYDNTHDSIGYDTNGYDEVCHATGITTYHEPGDSYSTCRIYWTVSDLGANKKLIGYFVYYLEAPFRNVTYFSGIDACSPKKFRRTAFDHVGIPMISKGDDSESWESVFIPFENLQRESKFYVMTLRNLKQYTQYAYYIRTQISLKHKDQVLNVTQGQSQVKYFTTTTDRLKPPIVRTREKTNTSLTLEWNPSTPENQYIEKYFIDVYVQKDNVDEIDKRNYCQNPREPPKVDDVIKTPEVICCSDKRAYLEYFRRGYNQTCGRLDPSCELTYENIMFHRRVENVLSFVDLQKPLSERYQFKQMSPESPKHHGGTTDPIKRNISHSQYYLHSHIIDDYHIESVVVPNLKPFHLYTFKIYACSSISNCSDYSLHFDRTEPSIYADDTGIGAMQDAPDSVTIIVYPPLEPNGVTVAYQFEIENLNLGISSLQCITRKQMAAMNYAYRIEDLSHGTHSFRVQSLSIGEDGRFSNYLMVNVDRRTTETKNLIWGIALTFIVIFLIITITTVYRKYTVCRSHQTQDAEFLLSEARDRAYSDINLSSTGLPVEANEHTPPKRLSLFKPSISSKEVKLRGQTNPPSTTLQPSVEGIQMTVFKSNITSSTLSLDNEPFTTISSKPTSSSIFSTEMLTPHSQPSVPIESSTLRPLQISAKPDERKLPRINMDDFGDDFFSSTSEWTSPLLDDSDN